jgi:adenine-specific DNA methylase
MIPKDCKRLAEVDFPIAEVSRHAAREKSIRHGHPSTLHLWWARRPLASCRAVLLGLLWPDPCDPLCPQAFRDEARRLLPHVGGCNPGKSDEDLRKALLRFIANFANWNLASNQTYLDVSRALVKAAHGEERPLVVDPFAGGGSIPLEALRVGCEAFASDLNPVACLILKVMLEDIPRHGPKLAEELRRVGAKIKTQAEKELADLYPKDPDGATPIAYLWARTVHCEAPNCGAEIPLMRSFWLSKKANRKRALRYRVERPKGEPPRVEFEVFEPKTEKDVPGGTVARAKATCVCCGVVLPPERVRTQLAAQRGGADVIFEPSPSGRGQGEGLGQRSGGARLLAVVTLKPGETGRHYRLPTERDYEAVRRAQARVAKMIEEWERNPSPQPSPSGRGSRSKGEGLCPVPDEPVDEWHHDVNRLPMYGMRTWGEAFTARQKVALVTLARLVRDLPAQIPDAVQAAMAVVVNRCADYNSANCRWVSRGEYIGNTYTRQALQMVWDFCEINEFGDDATGGYDGALDWVARVLDAWPGSPSGQVQIADATAHPLPDDAATIWFTDPPYYDAIPYADLSDFFFVWFKRICPGHTLLRDHFDRTNPLTPKTPEAVQNDTKTVDGRPKDAAFFDEVMGQAFAHGTRVVRDDGIGSVVFAHKTTEGWEALLSGMVRGGWAITGSWPIATENGSPIEGSRIGRSRHQRPPHLPPAPRRCRSRRLGRRAARTPEAGRRLDGASAERGRARRRPGLRLHRTGARSLQPFREGRDCRWAGGRAR